MAAEEGPRVTQHDVVAWLRERRWFYESEEGEMVPSDIPHHAAEFIARLRLEIAGLRGAREVG